MSQDIKNSWFEKGITPSVLKSVNFPPNVEYNNKMNADYNKNGF